MAAVAVVCATAFLPGAAAAGSTQPAAEGTVVTVVHLLPSLGPVDAFIDGAPTPDLAGFAAGEVRRSTLPPGPHSLVVVPTGQDPATSPVALRQSLTVGEDPVTYAAQPYDIDDDGAVGAAEEQALPFYPDDPSPTPAGVGRLVFRHAAVTGAMDVVVEQTDGSSGVRADALRNGYESGAVLPAGTYSVRWTVSGEPVAGLAAPDVPLREGTVTTLYAYGDRAPFTIVVDVSEVGTSGATTDTATESAAADPAEAQDPPPGDVPDETAGTLAADVTDEEDTWTGSLAVPALASLGLAALIGTGVSVGTRSGLAPARPRRG